MPKVYLAGPMGGLSYTEAADWRSRIAELLPTEFSLLSPLRGKEFLSSEQRIKYTYEERPISRGKAIVTRDGWDVGRCDAVLGYLKGAKRPSIGTIWEYGVAHALGKPVVTVMEEGAVHDHPMIRETSGFIVPTLEEAAEVLKALFLVPYGGVFCDGFYGS